MVPRSRCAVGESGDVKPVMNVVDAYWSDVVGASTGAILSGEGTNESRWCSTSGEQSGFRFDPGAPPAFSVDTDVYFSFGNFMYFNFPISMNSGVESAQLNLSALLDIDCTLVSEGSFNFSFLLDETSNPCSPCPERSNDEFTFQNLVTSDTFNVDGVVYTLDLLIFAILEIAFYVYLHFFPSSSYLLIQ